MQQSYHSHSLDHLGLVAGMFDELGIGEVIDRATQQNPETRLVTVGNAVKAMVLNGLGVVNQQLYLVPRFFHHKPTSRLLAPGIDAQHLNDDTLGRSLDTLYNHGGTARYSLVATSAAQRLGLTPAFAHLDSTSFHVDGRYNSAEAPDTHVIHITRGYSRDHRPDLKQVMLDVLVEHQAGIPLLRQPLSGNTSDAIAFRHVITAPIAQLHMTYGTAYLVADSALYNAENLQQRARTQSPWITRVPATLSEAQEALAGADPEAMEPLLAGYRAHGRASAYGGVAQRWMLIYSEHRRPQAQRTVEKQLRKQSAAEVKAFRRLSRTAFACEAEAQQALATFARGLQATRLHEVTIQPTFRYAKPGRPGKVTLPDAQVDHIAGALTSSLAGREALVAQHSCFSLATNERDEHALSPQALLAGDKGQQHAERGCRFLKDPLLLASSLYLKKPERIMALLLVMTVCLLVDAALEDRIRTALKTHQATFPNQKGQPIQNPTARWVFHYFVGIHRLFIPGEWPVVLNLTEEHRHLLRRLGRPYELFYS
jgi:transposase